MLIGTLVLDEPWPTEFLLSAMRFAALITIALSVLLLNASEVAKVSRPSPSPSPSPSPQPQPQPHHQHPPTPNHLGAATQNPRDAQACCAEGGEDADPSVPYQRAPSDTDAVVAPSDA